MTLLNRAAYKRHVLELSVSMRGGKFTRVSKEFMDRAERMLHEWTVHQVHSHPSLGKTIR